MLRKIKLADGTIIEVAKNAALPQGASEVADDLGETISKAVEAATAPLKAQLEQLGKAKATSNMAGAPVGGAEGTPVEGTDIRVGKSAAEGTGINFVRMAKAMGASALAAKEGRSLSPVDVLNKWGYKDIAKAFTASVLTEGGSMVPENFSAEFIELLRNRTAVRALGARSLPLPNGNLSLGRQTGGATAYYAGEGMPITTSKPTTDKLKLSEKKLVALTPVSNDLIRNAAQSAEEFVKQDLIAAMSLREDLAFLSGDGTQDTPRGMLFQVAAAHKYNQATYTAPKAPTLQELRTEFAKAFGKLKTANIPMLNCGFIISPRTEQYLMQVQDGNGNAIFESELLAGKLRGKPVVVTNQIPENLGGGSDESKIYLADFSEAIIGESMALELLVDPNGSYEEGGQTKSGLSRDETPIRVIAKHDFGMRHDKALVVIEAVRWGAP